MELQNEAILIDENGELQPTYTRTFLIKTIKNTYIIHEKQFTPLDLLLFEEKRIEPNHPAATTRSIGFLKACEWFIPNCYDIEIDDKCYPLIANLLDKCGFEAPHIISLISGIARVEGEVDFHDNTEQVADSDDFTFNGTRIKRLPISWRYTPQFLAAQARKDLTRINVDIITKYFTLNDQPITEEMLRIPGAMDVRLITLIINRLGKYFSLVSV